MDNGNLLKSRTIVAFRHGRFALNERSDLTGEAAMLAAAEEISPDADAIMDLLPEGRTHGEGVRQALGDIAIYACLHSPALRTVTMAKIALADQPLPGGLHIEPALRERSRGIFSYAPVAWADQHPLFPVKKSVLDWQPPGKDFNGSPGESIRQVRDTRILPVLQHAGDVAPAATAALSTHAEWMLALRAYILGFDDVRFRQPLVSNPPKDIRALTTAKMIGNGQIDMYDCTCTAEAFEAASIGHMDRFRSLGTDPQFDTGWLAIGELRANNVF